MSLFKQNITRKEPINKLLEPELVLNIEKIKIYKVEIFKNSTIYTTKAVRDLLLRFHYLLF